MEKINSTAIIAARKDSKGIKDKNLQKIGNTPLVEISILQATRTCKNVLVTTDSPEIISLAKSIIVISFSLPRFTGPEKLPSITFIIPFIKSST